MMELLAVKRGHEYLRFHAEGYTACGLNKASVYPLSALSEVQSCLAQLARDGIEGELVKLTITEEPFAADLKE